MEKIPIKDKVTLTISEAVEYSSIGRDKLYEMTNSPVCPFVLWSGKKRLIKREAFERYLNSSKVI